jgi:hypothetical protein
MRDRTGRREDGKVFGFRPVFLSSCLFLSGCGYHAIYASGSGAKLHVALSRSLVTDSIAADEVVSGVREQLARDGALAPGDGYPRVEIEVLRADETADAIAAPNGADAPRARGLQVAIVARAWIVSAKGEAPENDTGDLRATDLVAPEIAARADVFQHADATRAAARRVGHKLARKVLGHGAASED